MPTTRRQLLAVMFTDIVGYSAMVNRDERRAQALLEFQRRAVREQVFRHEGRIVDTIGDGHLVTFANARAAIECAVALQRQLQLRNAQPGAEPLRLRIGIHVGDIERSRRRVFGDGVNVAARLEPLAPHGGIAASAQAVAQLHGPLRAAFASRGPCELKNISEPHELFTLDESGLAAAAAHLPPPRPARLAWRRHRRALASGALALALSAAAVLSWNYMPLDRTDPSRLAVLPLQNLSGADSADFVAGLHDSLLTEVSRAPELKVISRTSVMRYAENAPPIPEIARALRVAWILEGSVQRTGPRVRINVQLIRARSDQHVWAKTYDRDAFDLFDVQTQIAREIARSMEGQVALEVVPAARRPTSSVEAYERYLRAIALEDNDPRLGRRPASDQIALLQQATGLDPQFALAWAALARYNIWSANWAAYVEPTRRDGYVAAAGAAASKAMELAPHQAESLLASGLALYWRGGDKRAVAQRFEEALAARPGYSLALFWLGSVYERLGDIERSRAALEALRELDPYNERVYTLLAQQLLNRREYAALEHLYDDWRAISESPGFVDQWRVQLAFYRRGDLAPWQDYVSRPVAPGMVEDDLAYLRYQLAMYQGRFGDAAAMNREAADAAVAGHGENYSAAQSVGAALALAGDARAAAPYLEASRRYFDAALAQSPDTITVLVPAAMNDALLGRREEALARCQRALAKSAPDPGVPAAPLHYLAVHVCAQVDARLGRRDRALQALAWLLREPSDVHAWMARKDPAWGVLRDDPGFRAVVDRALPAD